LPPVHYTTTVLSFKLISGVVVGLLFTLFH
jgi:F0F1-type ATP synthase assembly protein I